VSKKSDLLTSLSDTIRKAWTDKRDVFAVALIFLLGGFLYRESLQVPFVFDDYLRIVDNPFIKHLQPAILWKHNPADFLTNLTFAANYVLGRLAVGPWHAVNLLLHLVNSALVYFLIKLAFPSDTENGGHAQRKSGAAFVGALIFLVHPVQTQSVVYLVQRSTLLTAFCYLGAIFLYAKAVRRGHERLFAWSLVLILAGTFTKPAFVTFPLGLWLYDRCFLRDTDEIHHKRLLVLIAALAPLIAIPVMLSSTGALVQQAAESFTKMTFAERLLTELRVVMTYIRLLLAPVHQNLDYEYPVIHSALSAPALWSLGGIAALGMAAVRFWTRQRVIAFCIFWFFLTIAVVTLFPLPDLLFEHWLYLPCFAYAFLLSYGLSRVVRSRRWLTLVAGGLIASLAFLSWQRIGLWKDPGAILQDTAAKSPGKARVRNNLGLYYLQQGMLSEAQEEFELAIALSPDYPLAYTNLASVHQKKGEFVKAREILEKVIARYPYNAEAYVNLAQILIALGDTEAALSSLQQAEALSPFMSAVHIGLGNIYQSQGWLPEAKNEFETALWLNPENYIAAYNLGNIAYSTGDLYDALLLYKKALRISPEATEPLNNLGQIYFYFNDYPHAVQAFQKAVDSDQESAQSHYNLANALYADGQIEASQAAARRALMLFEKMGQTAMAESLRQKLDNLKR